MSLDDIELKSLFASKTFWGGFIAVLAGVLGFFGYELSPADQVSLIEAGVAIVASIGGLIAIFGRIRASKKIK